MEDFKVEHAGYVTGPDSVYPAYPFHRTARDMARFGLLCLRQGHGAANKSFRPTG